MEQLTNYVNIGIGALVVPLLEMLKRKYPNLNPASKVLISLAGVTAITYAVATWILGTPLPIPDLLDYSFKSQVVAQLVHALYNTSPTEAPK